nr:TIGR01458 family HAD-type hydrolase [Pseudonocardia sp. C8]
MPGLLVDIDGVLTVSWQPLDGATEAFAQLRAAGHPIKLVTNTTSRSRAWIADALRRGGFEVAEDDIVTAPVATAAHVAQQYPDAGVLLLNSGDIRDDLGDLRLVDDEAPDVVVVGGAGPEFDYAALNRAFAHLQRGVPLIAMQRNLFWRTDDGLQLDSGAFVTGLEAAAGVRAEVVGKPAESFFASALRLLGVTAADAVMVGDDVESDVLAAQRAGITGVLVRTGKFLPRTLEEASGTPDAVLDSFADLPAWLGQRA